MPPHWTLRRNVLRKTEIQIWLYNTQLIASGYSVMTTFSNYVANLCPGVKDSRTDQKQNVCINFVVDDSCNPVMLLWTSLTRLISAHAVDVKVGLRWLNIDNRMLPIHQCVCVCVCACVRACVRVCVCVCVCVCV